MSTNYFASAEKARIELTKAQKNRITVMYRQLAEDIDKDIDKLSQRSNVSSTLKTQYLQGLSKQINAELENIGTQQKSSIMEGMRSVSQAVVLSNRKMMASMGFQLQGAYSYVPRDVVAEIASGKLYEGRWSLNKAIWKNTKKTQADINRIVAEGVAKQKGSYEIAKDLEKYVNPAKAKPWDWGKVYPGTSRVVDYNAQRLARTMVSHAYQDSFVRTTKDNPFIEEYEWIASGGDRMCDICAERDGKHFSKLELPLDHPNGMCTFAIVTNYSMNDVADRLSDWVNGADDPELDTYARSMGYPIDVVKGSVKLP